MKKTLPASSGFENGRESRVKKKYRQLLGTGKGKKIDSPFDPPKKINIPDNILFIAW